MPTDRNGPDRELRSMLDEADAALDDEVQAGLQALADCAATMLPVDGAGLMLAGPDGVLRSALASDSVGRLLQTGQERLEAGPSMDAFRCALPVASSDLRVDDRWPDLRYLLPKEPLHAALATPVTLPDGPVGTLNVWRATPAGFSLAEITAVGRYTRVAASLLLVSAHAELRGLLLGRLIRTLAASSPAPDLIGGPGARAAKR
jgi:GAF domain-containing protein